MVLAEVHLGKMTAGTSLLFHYILNELQVPLITMCAYGDQEALSKCMPLVACFNVLKLLDPRVFNILREKAMEHMSRRVIPEGSSIMKKTMKHRQKLKQEQDQQQEANMKLVADVITSAYGATRTKSNNHLTTTQMKVTPGVAPAIRAQVERSSVRAEVSNTNTRTSVWDRYSMSLQDRNKSVWDSYEPKGLFLPYKQAVLPMPSKASIENTAPYAAVQKGYCTPVTSLLHQLKENSYTEAAGNMESFTLQKDPVNEVYATTTGADDVGDLVSNALLDGTENNYSTTEKMPSASDPLCGSELETFGRSQLEGQEQQDLGPDDLLQVENAWNHPLQSAGLVDARLVQESTVGDALIPMVQGSVVGDAPVLTVQESAAGVVQESAMGDAPADDPVNQFAIGDELWTWSPQMIDDYAMSF